MRIAKQIQSRGHQKGALQRQSCLRPLFVPLVLIVLVSGCGDSGYDAATAGQSSIAAPTATPTFPATPRTEFGGDRPVTIEVPTTYDAKHPAPLLIVLHGYGADGTFQEEYLKLTLLVEADGVLILAPDGTIDRSGSRFWNATPACCNFDGSTVDDVGYIRSLIADVRKDYNIDSKRIYLVGHSNGAFMAHRLACDAASEIAAIVALAGATFENPADCKPSEPVSVLDIHGDADSTVLYEGGVIGAQYPSETETMAHWQVYDQCTPGLVLDPMTLDLDFTLAGNETTIQRFNGCTRGTGVELWTIQGGGHIPSLTHTFPQLVWQWLNDHPKP